MPDDFDYAWLGWLIAHPDEWTPDDLAKAEWLTAEQRRAADDSHPKDAVGRARLLSVVEALEPAIETYRRLHAP